MNPKTNAAGASAAASEHHIMNIHDSTECLLAVSSTLVALAYFFHLRCKTTSKASVCG